MLCLICTALPQVVLKMFLIPTYITSSLVLHILACIAHSLDRVFLSESFEKEYKILAGSEKKGKILMPDPLRKRAHSESSQTSTLFKKIAGTGHVGSTFEQIVFNMES